MDDLISRQAVVEKIDLLFREPYNGDFVATHYNHGVGDALAVVKNLPSAQGYADTDYMEKMSELIFDSAFEMGKAYAQQWIPVTERLPKEDGRYLTTNGQGWYEVVSYAHGYGDLDAMYELPQDGGGWYIYDSEWGYCVYSSVVAWMPIEPWKGEKVE